MDSTQFSWRQPRSNPRPSFSADARQIAYTARGSPSTGTDLIVKDVATGRESLVYQSDADRLTCQYSAILPIIYCTSEIGGKTDLLSVSVDSAC